MPIQNALASVAVADLNAAVSWYENLFGRPADLRPMPEVAEWRFERGGWLQIYQSPQRAGAGSFTLAVEDIDEIAADLRNRGLDLGPQTTSPTVKTLMTTDPDGNHIAFAEALDPALAH